MPRLRVGGVSPRCDCAGTVVHPGSVSDMSGPVVVISDSSSVDPEMATRLDVHVAALHVVIGSQPYVEGGGATPEQVAEALQDGQHVSTSRPAPEEITRTYRSLADAGAREIVAVLLSGELSGTVESAQLAARESPVAVHVVDTRQLGMGAGFAVEAAAAARDSGGDGAAVADAARRRADQVNALFYVHTLDYLRRGGRVSTTAALVGSALAVKPLLRVDDGKVLPLERVRTATKALARLEELAIDSAGDQQVDIAVSHLAAEERAERLAHQLGKRVPGLQRLEVNQVGAVIGAHVGPGMVAVVVSPV